MEFTGERVIPGQGDVDVFNEHRARYLFARRFSNGKKVLDAACGTGYGSALLAENAAEVFGMDISSEAVGYARSHYESNNLHFGQADCLTFPFSSGQFDCVVAFEIIEHLERPEEFLKELCRVLTPDGLLLLSTPNRLYYTQDRGEVNPFHCREFSYSEFEEILKPIFPYHSVLFENHIAGLLVSGPDAAPDFAAPVPGSILRENGAADRTKDAKREAHYFIALCSARPLEPIQSLLYFPSTGNVLREREMHIRVLTQQLSVYIPQLQDEIEKKVQWAKELDQQLSEQGAYIRQLQVDHEEKIQWALRLEQELEQTRAALQKLQQEFEERTAWALRLDAELKQRSEELRFLYDSLWYRIGKKLRLNPVPPSDRASPGSDET
ncbi:MAG: methyltransferase domain-containing protein [Acidobacteria bacterium]|nr:methyltransferase domain-containing protein [Acidobacteriota bacterium]